MSELVAQTNIAGMGFVQYKFYNNGTYETKINQKLCIYADIASRGKT